MASDIWTDITGGVARLRFNRPEARNPLTMTGVAQVIDFLRAVDSTPGLRCLAISGAGDHFMAGGDFDNFTSGLAKPEAQIAADFEQKALDQIPIWTTLERLDIPVVCSVRGYAVGGALSFVAGADLAIASQTACFILGHVKMGLPPDAATTYFLPRAVGARRAKQIAFFGDRLLAEEARELGLVNWVVPDDKLEEKTEEVIARLASGPTLAIAEGRRLINDSLQSSISEQLTAEAQALARCSTSHDMREGVATMIEKRKAAFRGS